MSYTRSVRAQALWSKMISAARANVLFQTRNSTLIGNFMCTPQLHSDPADMVRSDPMHLLYPNPADMLPSDPTHMLRSTSIAMPTRQPLQHCCAECKASILLIGAEPTWIRACACNTRTSCMSGSEGTKETSVRDLCVHHTLHAVPPR